MSSSSQNNNSKGISDNNAPLFGNPNFINFNPPYAYSRIDERQEYNLPEQNFENKSNLSANKKSKSKGFIGNIFSQQKSEAINPQSNQSGIQAFNQSSNMSFVQSSTSPFIQSNSKNNQNFKQKMSKFDQELMQLMKVNEKPQQNIPINKVVPQKDERCKKTLNRLSQQFFSRPLLSEDNQRSKKKSRMTIGSFGFQNNRKIQERPIQQMPQIQDNYSGNNRNSLIPIQEPEKMQIEQPDKKPIFNTMRKEQKPFMKERQNLNILSNRPMTQQKRNFTHDENRLSEVKKRRDRLSAGMSSLFEVMTKIEKGDKGEKTKNQVPQQKRKRVTLNIDQFLRLNDEQQHKQETKETKSEVSIGQKERKPSAQLKQNGSMQSKQILKPQRLTQFFKPTLNNADKVIFEDQKQDEFTPLKQFFNNASQTNSYKEYDLFSPPGLVTIPEEVNQFEFLLKQEPINYEKQAFRNNFENIKQKIIQQRSKVEEMRKQKTDLLRNNDEDIKKFRITGQRLTELKKQEQDINSRIYHLRNKLSKTTYENNCKVINAFELKLGIKLHRYEKFAKVPTRNNQPQSFYTEFTYYDMVFRIKRGQKQQWAIKFMPKTTLKKDINTDFRFSFDDKKEFIQGYIMKKLKKAKSFLSFMVNLIAYCKAMILFEITFDHYIKIYKISDGHISETGNQIQYEITMGENFTFLWKIDMLKLSQNGGITVFRSGQKDPIKIPEEVLNQATNGNKIAMSIAFLDEYLCDQICLLIDQRIN